MRMTTIRFRQGYMESVGSFKSDFDMIAQLEVQDVMRRSFDFALYAEDSHLVQALASRYNNAARDPRCERLSVG